MSWFKKHSPAQDDLHGIVARADARRRARAIMDAVNAELAAIPRYRAPSQVAVAVRADTLREIWRLADMLEQDLR